MRTRCCLVAAVAVLLGPAPAGAQGDKIFLEDGKVLTSSLANPSLNFQTPNGTVAVPNEAVRKIERRRDAEGQDAQSALLGTVNDERNSGFLANEYAEMAVGGGPTFQVRKELIRSLGARERQWPHGE